MTVSASVLATANSTSTTTTLAFTPVTAAVGQTLVLVAAADNINVGGTSAYSTVTDSAGNTWTKRVDSVYSPGAAPGDGANFAIYDCFVTAALVAGTVTLNFSPNIVSKAGTIWGLTATEGEVMSYSSGAAVAGALTNTPETGSFSPGAEKVVFAGVAIETTNANTPVADTDTTDGVWSSPSDVSASSGTVATSQRSYSQWKVTTGASAQNWGISGIGTNKDCAIGWAAYSIAYSQAVGSASGQGTATGISLKKVFAVGLAEGSGDASSDTSSKIYAAGLAQGNGYASVYTDSERPVNSVGSVLYWQGFPGPAGYLDIPSFGQFPVDVTTTLGSLRTKRGFAYLLRTTLPAEGPSEAYDVIYPAASFGRSSAPDDTPANTYVPGLLLGSTINYSVSLFSGIEPTASSGGGSGAIVLLDPRGTIDNLINRSWDGATLDILQGDPKAKFNTFSIVGKMTTAGILYDQRKKEIRLRDQGWKLQQSRIHDDTYTGEGLIGGDPELKGQYLPIGFGLCRNIEPILINSVRQIRQLSNGPIQAVLAVRDGGVLLTYSGIDYANYAALAAAADADAIPLGQYATCLAQGLIATGSIPTFQLTCDMEGDNLDINGSGYADRIATIARRIAVGRGNLKLNNSDIDFAALNKLDQAQPSVSGWWYAGGGDMTTKADALQEIMNGRLGWWAVRLNGLLAFGIMEEPVGPPAIVINYPSDFSTEPTQLDTYQVPRHSTFLGYKRNYTVQDASAQAGAIVGTPEGILLSQESQFQGVNSTVPLWKVPTAQNVRVQTGLDDSVATLAEATRQQNLMGVRRERWTVAVPCDPFVDLLGKVVEIRNFPRYGWGNSRKFICIGQSFATGIAVRLTLWG